MRGRAGGKAAYGGGYDGAWGTRRLPPPRPGNTGVWEGGTSPRNAERPGQVPSEGWAATGPGAASGREGSVSSAGRAVLHCLCREVC